MQIVAKGFQSTLIVAMGYSKGCFHKMMPTIKTVSVRSDGYTVDEFIYVFSFLKNDVHISRELLKWLMFSPVYPCSIWKMPWGNLLLWFGAI